MNHIRYISAAAAASIVLCFGWIAFATTESSSDNTRIMFVQTASGMSFKDGKLTLMSPATAFFSDRPARVAGLMPCSNFVKAWSEGGEDSFKKNPPNAALVVFDTSGSPGKMAVTLQNPRFEGQNLIYDVSIIKGNVPEGMHKESALFIDDIRLASIADCGIYHCPVNGG